MLIPNVNHSIRVAAQKAGLSTHVVRIWERRYSAVSPGRTKTRHRFYTNQEIERLTLLRLATDSGHSIGNIANLPTEQLRALVESEMTAANHPLSSGRNAMDQTTGLAGPPPRSDSRVSVKTPSELLKEGMSAVAALDGQKLNRILSRASTELGHTAVLHEVLVPLIQSIGDSWQEGRLRAAHEHVATAVVRTFLGNFVRPYVEGAQMPELVVATPTGQIHELGAILVAAAANNHGWQVTYLGPSLPAEEIAGAALQTGARAVALSIVFPLDDPHLGDELEKLRRLLPKRVALLAGGRGAGAYLDTLNRIGATHISDITSIYGILDALSRQPELK